MQAHGRCGIWSSWANRSGPKSDLFEAWNAEERGELGAWAYSEQPLNPDGRVQLGWNLVQQDDRPQLD